MVDEIIMVVKYKPSPLGMEEKLLLQTLSKSNPHPSMCQAVQEEILAPEQLNCIKLYLKGPIQYTAITREERETTRKIKVNSKLHLQ